MDIGTTFLLIALTLVTALFVARPLVFQLKKPGNPGLASEKKSDHDHSTLLAKRDRVLNTLKELEFDHALGKIPEEDYSSRRNALRTAGVQVLKQLDEGGDPQPQSTPLTIDASRGDDELEKLIAERRRSRQEKAAGFCPQCGNPVQKSDKFCHGCGRTLS